MLNQVMGVVIAWALAMVGTLIILKLVDLTIGLRVTEDHEIQGLDLTQHGEEGYYLRSFRLTALKRRIGTAMLDVPERSLMTKVEAVIRTSKLDAVKDALHEIGVEGMTVWKSADTAGKRPHRVLSRAGIYRGSIPKTKVELVLADTIVEKAVQAISVAARTGKIGDGKIFLSRVDDVIRIRNEERGEGAL